MEIWNSGSFLLWGVSPASGCSVTQRVVWINYCHCCSYRSLFSGCTGLTLCCSGNAEQHMCCSLVGHSQQLFYSSSQCERPPGRSARLQESGRSQDKGRLSFLIAANERWAAEGWVWIKEEEGTSKGGMKSLDFALVIYWRIFLSEHNAWRNCGKSLWKCVWNPDSGLYTGLSWPWPRYTEKIFQLCTARLSVWPNYVSVGFGGLFYYLWAHQTVKWINMEGWLFSGFFYYDKRSEV